MATFQISKNGLLLLSLPIFITLFSFSNGSPENFKLPYVEKQTHISFYYYEIIAGAPNATDFIVAGPNMTSYAFTDVAIYDVPMRETNDLNSAIIGRVQGIFAFTSMVDLSSITLENIVFMSGEYKGSVISILGWMPNITEVERPIIGGTGHFRLARGSVFTEILTITSTMYVAKFDVYVLHY